MGGGEEGDIGEEIRDKQVHIKYTHPSHRHALSLSHTHVHTLSLTHTHTYTPCLSSHLPTAGHLITTSIVWVGGESRERPSQARGSTLHLLHFGTIGEGGGGGGR